MTKDRDRPKPLFSVSAETETAPAYLHRNRKWAFNFDRNRSRNRHFRPLFSGMFHLCRCGISPDDFLARWLSGNVGGRFPFSIYLCFTRRDWKYMYVG